MSKDISRILKEWPYTPDGDSVRTIVGDDGRERIQRRIDIGVLQIHADGRPDGQSPRGFPSLYEYYQHEAKTYESDLPDRVFRLSSQDCEALQAEALIYYQRRLCFFELKDYARAALDARRNLEVFAFVKRYASEEQDILAMDQYRAFVIFHRAKAEFLGALKAKNYKAAVEAIEAGDSEVREFFREYGREDLIDTSEELRQLREWRKKADRLRPVSPREKLERELQKAVEREDYERAAQIRDELRKGHEQP
jgi:hypothetical protein